jgi:hypothetical protein
MRTLEVIALKCVGINSGTMQCFRALARCRMTYGKIKGHINPWIKIENGLGM